MCFYKVEAVAKISTNKLSTFDFFNFNFTTCFNPKQGPLQVSLHFELILYKILRLFFGPIHHAVRLTKKELSRYREIHQNVTQGKVK